MQITIFLANILLEILVKRYFSNKNKNSSICFLQFLISLGGETSEEVFIQVQARPQVSVIPVIKPYRSGETINIECIARGDPTPEIKWFKGDRYIQSTEDRIRINNFHLIIEDARYEDQGEYSCVAENPAGTGWSIISMFYIWIIWRSERQSNITAIKYCILFCFPKFSFFI